TSHELFVVAGTGCLLTHLLLMALILLFVEWCQGRHADLSVCSRWPDQFSASGGVAFCAFDINVAIRDSAGTMPCIIAYVFTRPEFDVLGNAGMPQPVYSGLRKPFRFFNRPFT